VRRAGRTFHSRPPWRTAGSLRPESSSVRNGGAEIELALQEGAGLLVRREHRRLVAAIDHAVETGRLQSLLPGVYVGTGEPDLPLRARALMAWSPDAVVTGRAAAKLTFWPSLRVDHVDAAVRRVRIARSGYRLERRIVEPDLVVEQQGLRITTPALTVLDLCPSVGGDAIDTALRVRCVTLAELHRVLEHNPHRRGNALRRALLVDSRAEPWSEAERRAHQLLRAAGLLSWVTNYPVSVAGSRYFVDIAFPAAMLAIEIDGRVHDRYDAFEYDRARQNDLVLQGWRVLRFTWAMLVERPDAVLLAIRRALGLEQGR
jgi:very-short-patch-repair endonuclease